MREILNISGILAVVVPAGILMWGWWRRPHPAEDGTNARMRRALGVDAVDAKVHARLVDVEADERIREFDRKMRERGSDGMRIAARIQDRLGRENELERERRIRG